LKNKSSKFSKIKKFFLIAISVMLVIFLFVFGVIINEVIEINSQAIFNKQKLISLNSKLELYDNNDEFIENTSVQNEVISLDKLPSYVPEAFISIEDKNFYKHSGLNYKRILRLYMSI
jgi:penicillin-binding protein 1A